MLVLLGLLLLSLSSEAKPFPVEDLGEIPVAQDRIRLAGSGWTVELPAIGGIWPTKMLRADFDGNGTKDYWLQIALPVGGARCYGLTQLYWIRFDEKGKPSLEAAQSYAPHSVTDNNGDGRAEFRLTDCLGKTIAQWEEDPLRAVYQPDSDWSPLQTLAYKRDIPEIVIRDSPEHRVIQIEKTLFLLRRAMRDGHATAWLLSSRTKTRLLWIDESRQLAPALQVQAKFHITKRRLVKSGELIVDGHRAELLPDGRSVRHSYTAMEHTNVFDITYEAPPGAKRLLYGRLEFAQWSTSHGEVLTLHDEQGKLLESRVAIDVPGRLIGDWSEGLAFVDHRGVITVVDGEIRWSR